MTSASNGTTWNVLDRAHDALRDVVRGVDDEDWQRRTPCSEWTVAQVFHHAAGDQLAYVSALTGEGGPTENPFAPSAELRGPAGQTLGTSLAAAASAFSAVEPGASAVPTPLPMGAMPAEDAVAACALDAAVHAWDLAVATGQPSPLTAELAEELLPIAHAIAAPLRGFAFGPALDSQDGDGPAEQLLRHLGRDPHWPAGLGA
jgi:uncharacterized protein (TIGR03086 family)